VIKFSKKVSFFIFFIATVSFGLFLNRDINEYNPDGGSFFSQFNQSFLGLSLTCVSLYYYLKALKEEKKIKQKE